jgi:predicted Zn-dependent protease
MRKPSLARLAALVCFVLWIVAGCKNAPPPAKLYFVPIGATPTDQIYDLVEHYRAKFGIQATVLPAMKVDDDVLDTKRNQLVAEDLIQSMLRNYRNIAQDQSAVLIGITAQDMYPRGADWQFCFGWRTPKYRAAVVSTARMDLHYPDEPGFEATATKRLRKMVTKDIGTLYYGMPLNGNPKSVLYGRILGIQELDQVSEDF